jgi:hypothetical protein
MALRWWMAWGFMGSGVEGMGSGKGEEERND